MTKDEIIVEINNHLRKSRKAYYQDYYIGITADVQERLFTFHQVRKDQDWWIYCRADSEAISRATEKHYLDLGMDGNLGGGCPDNPPIYVYCYEINKDHTKER